MVALLNTQQERNLIRSIRLFKIKYLKASYTVYKQINIYLKSTQANYKWKILKNSVYGGAKLCTNDISIGYDRK